jgi:hypothetical protein
MSINTLSITTDSDEYCRYAIGQNIITVLASVIDGTLTEGELLLVQIKRPAVASWPEAYRPVMSKTISISLADVAANAFSTSFTLGVDDMDADGITRCISNTYDITITDTSNALLSWTVSQAFHVVLVSSAEIRKEWCFGAPLRTTDVMGPKFQPKKITGVLINEVSPESVPGTQVVSVCVSNGN